MCACTSHLAPTATATPATATPATGTVFKVEDMTCAHCVGTIRNALSEAMPGVQVEVDLEQQRVTVDGDAEMAASVIREAGYEPAPLAH